MLVTLRGQKVRELLHLVIISFILITLMCDSGVILLGEIRCWSLLGVKRFRKDTFGPDLFTFGAMRRGYVKILTQL